jgi:hypothetical protein
LEGCATPSGSITRLGSAAGEPIFTNSNMNQMATVARELSRATGDREYLEDALLVWNGDGKIPGIEQQWYRGKGTWIGRGGMDPSWFSQLRMDGNDCLTFEAHENDENNIPAILHQ